MHVDVRELGAIFAGGFIGATARAGAVDLLPHAPGAWPWGTFVVNAIGAFLLGYFVTRLQERLPLSAYRRPFLGTGLCGGLTTFSTMQVELLQMLEPTASASPSPTPRAASRSGSPGSRSPATSSAARDSRHERLRPRRPGAIRRRRCHLPVPGRQRGPVAARAPLPGRDARRERHGGVPPRPVRGVGARRRRLSPARHWVGAYTTFSTWALESHRHGEDGELRAGAANFAVSLVLGVLVAWVGRSVGGAL